MPIDFSPPRRLLDAFIRYRDRKRQLLMRTGSHLTHETIEASNKDGTYQIKGKNVGQAGEAQLRAGETAVVAWKDHNTPTVVLAHSARRIKPVSVTVGGGPIVEELVNAPLTAPSGAFFPDTDVWFRNSNMVVPLKVTEKLGVPSVSFGGASRGWGFQRRHFLLTDIVLVVFGSPIPGRAIFYDISISGSPDQPQTGAPSITGTRKVDLAANGLILGSAIIQNSHAGGFPPITTVIKLGELLTTGYRVIVSGTVVERIFGSISDAFLNAQNQIIITLDVGITPHFGDLGLTPAPFSFPVIINIDTNQILYNGLTTQGGDIPVPPTSGPLLDAMNFEADSVVQVANPTKTSALFRLVPLVDKNGTWINSIGAVAYLQSWPFGPPPTPIGQFAAFLFHPASGKPSGTLIPLRTSGTGSNVSSDFLFVVTSDQRYVLWAHATNAAAPLTSPIGVATGATYDPVRVTDFVTVPLQDVAGPTDARAFFKFDPVFLTPSLLYLFNTEPADLAQTDLATMFAQFRTGTVITLGQIPKQLPGSAPVGILAKYGAASAFIPTFLADFLEDPLNSDQNLAALSESLKYQVIPLSGGGFVIPPN